MRGTEGEEGLEAAPEGFAGPSIAAEEADEVGLGDGEEVGEMAGFEGAGEPEVAETVEVVGVVFEFNRSWRRKGEEEPERFQPLAAGVPRLRSGSSLG